MRNTNFSTDMLATRLAACPLTLEERDLRRKNIRGKMAEQGLSCLVIHGEDSAHHSLVDNVRYLSNTPTHGFLLFPLEGEPTLFASIGPEKGRRMQREVKSWVEDVRTGHPLYSRALAARIRELKLEDTRIGAVGLGGYFGEEGTIPYTTYARLQKELPTASFVNATDILENSRLVKTTSEIKCLEISTDIADEVLETISETAKEGVRDYEVVSRILYETYVRGSEPGGLVLYNSGSEISHAAQRGRFPPPSLHELKRGDIVMIEHSPSYFGYMSQYNQPFYVGEMTAEYRQIYEVAEEAFNKAIRTIKAGVSIGEVDTAIMQFIEGQGFASETVTFHGIGLANNEAPYGRFPVQPDRRYEPNFRLASNMTLEVEPHVQTLDGRKGLHLGAPVLVTEGGCRLMSKIWEPEFLLLQ